MFGYYFNLALRSFRRNRVLTALMVLAIALGIGASMTTLTVFYVLSGDPIPQKSDRLFNVLVDPQPKAGFQPGEEPDDQVTRFDAEALLREKRAKRQALMTGGQVAIEPDKNGIAAFKSVVRFTSADFFPMFEAPFLYGQAWSAGSDEKHERVAVITKKLNDKLFDGGNSVGRDLRMDKSTFRIVGVLKEWNVNPRFYDLSNSYGSDEQVYLPFSVAIDLKMDHYGGMNCFGKNDNSDQTALNASCTWMQYWVELDSPAKAGNYKAYLDNYSDQQRAAGRFQRPNNTRLRNVMEWLDYKEVVPGDVRLQLWLAMGFLLVCLLNTVGLLLAKFLRRSGEIGVRRALGASRGAIFAQCLVEAGTIGLAGGIAGLGLAWLGLWVVRQQPVDYAKLAHLDPKMLLLTFAIALIASLLAGLLPSWRAIQVTPALQLKAS
ncbi:ABC transporter permease [Xanthomonas vasicola]|uniref:ABC transporter permease n=1 Tax=Xanthomonas vasicola TaxID=56459 RepID=UPI0001CBF28C|nr:ABC transporter permease [Xanthomonas vasicola]KFA16245.1 ABC transporter ATP-binding protein [Xanthomonas vasicola pv. musacearum NCPPB 4384]AZR32468.1 FtsX-like permease family protein [Xanthomonas vasicola pv. musacearum NCPPB 4379]KFA11706.1 ABC transporter ATP-binding protein [Xanthomonas vasicola pv. musacearum NCPPB 2005]KFA12152.1 ABC transporter ATP-binding protein [Xanthomonas vasicola pv. musacearum NCPPB 4380]KFA18268.1 ABC transporter ATP-binding protein [Xanthomonas vasicola p